MRRLMLVLALLILSISKGNTYDTLIQINARVTGNTCTVETNSKQLR